MLAAGRIEVSPISFPKSKKGAMGDEQREGKTKGKLTNDFSEFLPSVRLKLLVRTSNVLAVLVRKSGRRLSNRSLDIHCSRMVEQQLSFSLRLQNYLQRLALSRCKFTTVPPILSCAWPRERVSLLCATGFKYLALGSGSNHLNGRVRPH